MNAKLALLVLLASIGLASAGSLGGFEQSPRTKQVSSAIDRLDKFDRNLLADVEEEIRKQVKTGRLLISYRNDPKPFFVAGAIKHLSAFGYSGFSERMKYIKEACNSLRKELDSLPDFAKFEKTWKVDVNYDMTALEKWMHQAKFCKVLRDDQNVEQEITAQFSG